MSIVKMGNTKDLVLRKRLLFILKRSELLMIDESSIFKFYHIRG